MTLDKRCCLRSRYMVHTRISVKSKFGYCSSSCRAPHLLKICCLLALPCSMESACCLTAAASSSSYRFQRPCTGWAQHHNLSTGCCSGHLAAHSELCTCGCPATGRHSHQHSRLLHSCCCKHTGSPLPTPPWRHRQHLSALAAQAARMRPWHHLVAQCKLHHNRAV